MLGENGPLASLVPGKLAEVVRLPDAGPLERFRRCRSRRLPVRTIQVPRLTDVVGNIEAYSGRRPTDLPLVVRSARGFGEIAFAGVDFSEPPLADWSGRTAFLQALLRPYVADERGERFVATARDDAGYNDLSGALRQQLGRIVSPAWCRSAFRSSPGWRLRICCFWGRSIICSSIAGCAGRWWRGFRFR